MKPKKTLELDSTKVQKCKITEDKIKGCCGGLKFKILKTSNFAEANEMHNQRLQESMQEYIEEQIVLPGREQGNPGSSA
jgi:hypothetical protein